LRWSIYYGQWVPVFVPWNNTNPWLEISKAFLCWVNRDGWWTYEDIVEQLKECRNNSRTGTAHSIFSRHPLSSSALNTGCIALLFDLPPDNPIFYP
jgi:hypothetical protein